MKRNVICTVIVMLMCAAIILLMATVSVRAEDPKNYWTKFGVGSWVLLEMPGGTRQKQTLMKKSSESYTLKMETIVNGKAVYSNEVVIPLKSKATGAPTAMPTKVDVQVKQYKENVTVKNKSLACDVSEVKTAQGTSKNWMSDQIPGGVVKTTLNNSPMSTAIDFEVK